MRECLQVKPPFDIPELRRRLISFGVYRTHPGITDAEQTEALATRLHLDSFVHGHTFMEFLPLLVPYAGRADLPERVIPVTLISSDGRQKPIMFGLILEQVHLLWAACALLLSQYGILR